MKNLDSMIEGMDLLLSEETSTQMKHCVLAVAKKNSNLPANEKVSKAFAICNAQFQKSGFVQAGSTKLTGKGKENEKKHKSEKDMKSKLDEYEKLLKQAKKSRKQNKS